jgi:AcrR family transcriptional regulator
MAPPSDSERAEARRQQVLDAAAQCFRAHGFHGASMAEIARTAGMSPGHIYNLFDNKEDLIAAIVARDQANWLAKSEAMLRAPDVLQAMLDGVALGVEDCTTLADAALRLEVAAEAGRNPKLATIVQGADAASRERCKALLHTALAAIFDGLMVRCVRETGLDRAALTAEIRRLVLALVQA